MARTRVAVVFGGRSSEHGVSVVSAGSVIAALDPERYEVVPIGITPDGQWVLADGAPQTISGRTLPSITDGRPVALTSNSSELVSLDVGAAGTAVETLAAVDVVFPVLHGRWGEDGTIQGLLELAGVPYVGAGVFASAAGMDKEYTKILLRAAGLDVGDFTVLRQGRAYEVPRELGLPVFVKPARAGSSVGITRVDAWDDFDAAVEVAFGHDTKVIVESAVTGREIECGVLENADGVPEASLPAEIRLRGGHEWYDFEAKYLDDACDFDVPAQLPDDVVAGIRDAAGRAFVALDCAGLARVDFFVTSPEHGGRIVVNEVNTMPGFTPISLFPRMWAAAGVDFAALVDRLIASALRRG